MIKQFCDGFFQGFLDYNYDFAEEITGISVCLITFNSINIGSELFHSGMSIFTALISAYLIHRFKLLKYKLPNPFKNDKKKN